MTVAIHHGDPGSFKSFGTLQRVVVPALQGKHELYEEGRTVVTNIRGLDAVDRIEKALGKELPQNAEIININSDKREGLTVMSRFFHWAPAGALIVIDEAQKIYNPKRDRDLKKYDLKILNDNDEPIGDVEALKQLYPYWDGNFDRPQTVEEAFDEHRHMNWDIYILTPNIAKLHPEIRQVAETAFRHRCRGALLPWWRNHWKEFEHDPESSGKSVSHYEGVPKKYKADAKYFDCYKSTKTGKAKTSTETRYLYRDPKLIFLGSLFVLLVTYFITGLNDFLSKGAVPGAVETDTQAAETTIKSQQVAPDPSGDIPVTDVLDVDGFEARFQSVGLDTAQSAQQQLQQALKSGELFIFPESVSLRIGALLTTESGKLFYRVVAYEQDQRLQDFTQDDIKALGYHVERIGNALKLISDHQQLLIRRWVVGSHEVRQVGAAVQADSSDDVATRLNRVLGDKL